MPADERGARIPETPVAPPPVAASLSELATEVALLNALSTVLQTNHEVTARRAAAASARLQRAQLLVSAYGTAPPAPTDAGADPASPGDIRDSRAEARRAAARDAASAQRGRERLIAHTGGSAPSDDEAHAADAAAVAGAGAAPPSGAAAHHTAALRSLLDFVVSDTDFASVLALLSSVGGRVGPPPASDTAISAVPETRLVGAAAQACACPVCLADLGAGAVRCLPCGKAGVPHAFHSTCIEQARQPRRHAIIVCVASAHAPARQWLKLHNSCPVCRAVLAEPRVRTPRAS